jgi:hypothetical protein
MNLLALALLFAAAPEIAFKLPDADMIAEDLLYDAGGARFLVSAVHRGGIDAVDSKGQVTRFVPSGANDGWGIFAIGADEKRGLLWAATSAMPISAHFKPADAGKSALLSYDLRSGEFRGRYLPPDEGVHSFGDLTVAPSGDVYVSDGLGSGVYLLPAGAQALRVLVPRGVLKSPQTPALSADGQTLFVPDYAKGLAAVSTATGKVRWLDHGKDLELRGIDGLVRQGNQLFVMQNGVLPNRILRLTVEGDRVAHWEIVARAGLASEITHAVIRGAWLYFIVRSGWDRAGDDGTMKPGKEAPALARVRIDRLREAP